MATGYKKMLFTFKFVHFAMYLFTRYNLSFVFLWNGLGSDCAKQFTYNLYDFVEDSHGAEVQVEQYPLSILCRFAAISSSILTCGFGVITLLLAKLAEPINPYPSTVSL